MVAARGASPSIPPARSVVARPAAVVSLDVARSVAHVRALFFDVDLAVRTRLHKGMRLRWQPRTAGGERCLTQITRVLDQRISEEIVIEPGPDGTWVKRYVSGANAGTRFVGRFAPINDVATTILIEAFVGPRGFAQGLGRLSPLGLEKALQRTLSDYGRVLEKYVPGRARGRVVDALIDMGAAVTPVRRLPPDQHRLVITTLLEAAWAVAAVDEPPDEAERDAMQAIAGAFCKTVLDDAVERRMVRDAVDAIAREGAGARCDALGARLKALGFGELGVSVAVLVAEVSRGLDTPELSALGRLAAAAGIDHARLTGIVRRTDEILSGGDRVSRMSFFV